jgi:hypothetical protein
MISGNRYEFVLLHQCWWIQSVTCASHGASASVESTSFISEFYGIDSNLAVFEKFFLRIQHAAE